MRILLINYEFPPLGGGGGAFSKDLAVELAKNNEIDVLTTQYTGLARHEKIDNINIYRIPVLFRKSLYEASIPSMLSFPLSALIKGLSLFKQKKYDIINTHFAIPTGPVGSFLSSITNVPNIVNVHGSDIYNPASSHSPHNNMFLKWVVKKVLNNADLVIAQSEDMKFYTNKFYSCSDNVKVFPLGLPDLLIDDLSQKSFEIKEKGLKLVSIGRMAKVKGYDHLIRAIPLLAEKLPDITLTLIGDGPERIYLERLTNELGLSDKIRFTGWLSGEKKYKTLLASDIYVMSSLHEGFGVVLLEAMTCGLPTIVTNSGGQTDIIKDKVNGSLVNSSDERALARSIADLVLNKETRSAMSENNRIDINNFKISRIAEKYIEIFNKAVTTKAMS